MSTMDKFTGDFNSYQERVVAITRLIKTAQKHVFETLEEMGFKPLIESENDSDGIEQTRVTPDTFVKEDDYELPIEISEYSNPRLGTKSYYYKQGDETHHFLNDEALLSFLNSKS